MPRIFHEADLRKGRYSQPRGLYLITKCLKPCHQLAAEQRDDVVNAFLHARSRGILLLHAFVVMPDHWHVLGSLGAQKTLSQSVWSVCRRASFAWRKFGRKPQWQDGFHDHKVRGDETVLDIVHYIESNPVRKKFVAKPEEWLWSSARPESAEFLDRAFLGHERW